MMPAELLQRLVGTGFRVWVEAGNLHFKPTPDAATVEDLRQHKDEIIALLVGCPGRGEFTQSVAASTAPGTPLADELDRLDVAVRWAVRVADFGTSEEQANLGRLIDQAMDAEAARDLETIRTVAEEMGRIAWKIGEQVRGPDGAEEDAAERLAIQDPHLVGRDAA